VHLDRLAVVCHPLQDALAAVDRVTIDDQVDLAAQVCDQPVQERDEHTGVERPGVDSEIQLPVLLIAHMAFTLNLLPVLPTTGVWPLGAQVRPCGRVRADPGLVQPQHHRALGAGACGDRWIVPLQPPGDLAGVLLVGPANRLLRRQTPAAQVLADHGQAQLQAVPGFDQLGHRLVGPLQAVQPKSGRVCSQTA
jgi:hypothetical protein